MKLNVVLNTEPYWYNCRNCGKPIMEKTVAVTEVYRKRGTCSSCSRKLLAKLLGSVLVVEQPTPTARWN